MDAQEFYQEKKKIRIKLERELLTGKHSGQPELEDGLDENEEPVKRATSVYVTSVRKREAATVSGHVCEATLEIASLRIADGTHRISTEDEIKKYLGRQVQQKIYHDKQETKNGVQRTMRVSPTDVDPMPAHLAAFANEQVNKPVPSAKR